MPGVKDRVLEGLRKRFGPELQWDAGGDTFQGIVPRVFYTRPLGPGETHPDYKKAAKAVIIAPSVPVQPAPVDSPAGAAASAQTAGATRQGGAGSASASTSAAAAAGTATTGSSASQQPPQAPTSETSASTSGATDTPAASDTPTTPATAAAAEPTPAPTAAATPTAGAATATAAATTTQASQPHFADDDPDSPFHVSDIPVEVVWSCIDDVMRKVLQCHHWESDWIVIPAIPMDGLAAMKLERQVQQLLREGKTLEATTWQCQMALFAVVHLPDQKIACRLLWELVQLLGKLGIASNPMLEWLVPRAAKKWGLRHPDTRQLAWHAAQALYETEDPRPYGKLTQAVYNLARARPGGLGCNRA